MKQPFVDALVQAGKSIDVFAAAATSMSPVCLWYPKSWDDADELCHNQRKQRRPQWRAWWDAIAFNYCGWSRSSDLGKARSQIKILPCPAKAKATDTNSMYHSLNENRVINQSHQTWPIDSRRPELWVFLSSTVLKRSLANLWSAASVQWFRQQADRSLLRHVEIS